MSINPDERTDIQNFIDESKKLKALFTEHNNTGKLFRDGKLSKSEWLAFKSDWQKRFIEQGQKQYFYKEKCIKNHSFSVDITKDKLDLKSCINAEEKLHLLFVAEIEVEPPKTAQNKITLYDDIIIQMKAVKAELGI